MLASFPRGNLGQSGAVPATLEGGTARPQTHGQAPRRSFLRHPGIQRAAARRVVRTTWSSRPRPAPPPGTFVPDEKESAPARERPRPTVEGPAGAPRDFLQVHVHPGAARRAQRTRTRRAWPSGGRGLRRARGGPARGDGPGTMGAAERARGQRGPGRRAAARLALPGRRMRRRLGTDAPRARCMLMAGGRAMNYSAAARRGRARRGGRPWPCVPRRCEAAAATSQTFPGPHRGCGPRGAAVPARARRPRFPRCRLFYVFCLGVGTCPRERVSLPTPSPPDRGGGGGTGDPGRRGQRKQCACGHLSPKRSPGGGGRSRTPGHPCSAGRSGLRTRPEYRRGACGPRSARCG